MGLRYGLCYERVIDEEHRELKRIPSERHFFCPRLSSDTNELGDEQESKSIRDKFFAALPLLAFDGEECVPYHKWIYSTLDEQLSRCDACIRSYHLAKVDFKQNLLQDFDADEVQQFLDIINRRDVSRIRQGLDAAKGALGPLPHEQRRPGVLNNYMLFAFYETLQCPAFFNEEQALVNHFDEPFKMVQTHKELKIKEVLPAITDFLFCTNQFRLSWAVKTWKRLDREVTDQEWDWAVKDILMKHVNSIQNTNELQRFWSGVEVIIDRLTPDQIKHKLFDMGFNFARLALDHLARSSMAIKQIAGSLKIIWNKAPEAFWNALTSVSGTTVAEQFFASPNFEKCLVLQAESQGRPDAMDVLSWIEPFLAGLQPGNRPPTTKFLVHQLFSRAAAETSTNSVKTLCFEAGLRALTKTVIPFAEDGELRKATARPVLSDALDLVASHLPTLLTSQKYTSQLTTAQQTETRATVVLLVKASLMLDTQVLKQDYELLQLGTPKVSNSSYTPDLWNTVKKNLNADQTDLSMAMVKSGMDLLGLEHFVVRDDTACKPEKESFNTILGNVEQAISQCVDRLTDFPAQHLDSLFAAQDTNMAVMALLFSGNDGIYQAAVEMFKAIAQQPGREEALLHVVDAFFSQSLYSICWVFRRLSTMMPFQPIPRLLQTGKDIMDIVCDSSGLLRTKSLEDRDRQAVQAYWSYSWQMMTMIFRRMEKWSIEVGDKALMTEVCRDTMQYAQKLFNHYYIFLKVLSEGRAADAKNPAHLLLSTDVSSSSGSPPKALDSMVKWLRLRDPYLAETLANLFIDMLRRLKEFGSEIPHDSYALTFVEEVAAGKSVAGKGTRTILNNNQKAGLIRALEDYTGKQILRSIPPIKKQQQRLDIEAWSGKGKTKSEAINIDDDDTDVKREIRSEAGELAAAERLRREALLGDKKSTGLPARLSKKPTLSGKASGPLRTEQLQQAQAARSQAFIEERKKAAAAAKAKQAEIAARARGQGGLHTANAGSGLSGLGVQGKDHSIKKSDLMVDSDSESDSDSDDELFGKSKTSSGTSTPLSRGGQVTAMPIKKIKAVRTAKDMRARLSPDLTSLHKTILSWDFFADTDTPPSSNKSDYTLVTDTFKTVQDYQRTFEPLLILEGWQSFRQAREDGTFKPFEVKVSNSLIVDNFFEVNTTMSMADGRDLSVGPSDVVLLSKGSRPHAEPTEPHCLARVKEITRKRGEIQITYRVNSANNPMKVHLHDKATVWAINVLNLTPLEREYGALMALPYYDLVDEIIRAKPSPLLEYTDEEVEEIKELHNLNIAQAKAVKSAVDNDAFTLVQGPPGSGKTKTITAILSAIITGMFDADAKVRSRATLGPPPSNKKILVAAPSNAAVDELVMRFKDGIKVTGGQTQKINVVRLGRSEAINSSVKDVTLEELVSARIDDTSGINGKGKEDIQATMMEHKDASEQMHQLRLKMDETRQKGDTVSDADDQLFEALKRKKTALSNKIDQQREKQNSASRDADVARRRIEQEILDSAHVLCATLSGSGHEKIQGLNVEFETVIIDEAAQSIELSALIPLKYGCAKCILVGDPKQLPPTVLSRQAAKFQYEQSLFARMEINHKRDIHLLDVQYRMHPEISAFPSQTFYDSKLKDGPGMAKLRFRPWHRSAILSPYRFFDVQGMSKSAPKGRSLVNEAEIDVALAMYERLIADVSHYNFRNKIGIITPYKGQLKALKERFRMRHGDDIWNRIDFNTTDAFQGRESEIIIFSCVRASVKGIGFLNDVRRMNVGLTRAKCSLWVLGNSESLVQGEFWRALVENSKKRSLYTDGEVAKIFSRPLLTKDMMKDDVEMGGTDETNHEIVQAVSKPADSRPLKTKGTDDNAIKQDPHMTAHGPEARNGPDLNPPRLDAPRSSEPPQKPSSSSVSSVRLDVESKTPGSTIAKTGETPTKQAAVASNLPKNPQETKHSSRDISTLKAGRNCDICGSSNHIAFNCNNSRAKEAQTGNCFRCGESGHSKAHCTAIRCLACGVYGHSENKCTIPSTSRLSPQERQDVQKQERHFTEYQNGLSAKLAKKQLGEHGATIPVVKTDDPAATKRKRDSISIEAESNKASRTTEQPSAAAAASKGSRPPGPPGIQKSNGQPLIRKKRDDANGVFARKR